ncbi:MAG: polysaccharide biosynthesis tyrosine autokinase [Flavobacteriales bacterium]
MAEQRTNFIDADDLRPVLKFIAKSWHLIVLCCLVAFTIAYFYTHRLQEIYAARTEILLKSEETYDYQNKIYSDIGYYSLFQDVTNQQRVLTSYDLIKRVLTKIDFSISYYLVGRIKTSQVDHFDAISVQCDWRRMNVKLHNKPIFIKVIDLDKCLITYDLEGIQYNRELQFGKRYEDGNFVIQVNLSPWVDGPGLNIIQEQTFMIQVHPESWLIQKFTDNLQVTNVEYTSILSITCKDELATRATRFLDSLAQVYIDFTLENQFTINENTQRYIDLQLDELVRVIDSLERSMEIFKDSRKILDLNREQSAAFDALTDAEAQKRQLELKIQSIDALEEFLTRERDNAVIPPMSYIGVDETALRDQITAIFDLRQRKANLSVDLKDADVRIQRIESEINTIRSSIYKYTADTKESVRKRITDLNKQIRELEGILSTIPKSERDLLSIERKLNVNEQLFTFLLEKKANTAIAKAAIIPQTSVIESARSLGVVGPNKKGIIYYALGIGLLVSLVIGVLRMVFLERIENIRELKSITKLAVLGGVPNYPDSDLHPIALVDSPRGNVSEAFRALRTNLQYMLPHNESNLILITSLHPGEGKTFVSSNLAAVLAKASKRVLILDFDLHKPKVHKIFGFENVSGVSSYLIGRSDYRDSILPTQVQNLDVLTAGPVPPNASELILNNRVDQLLRETSETYDYVIVDTPPVMLISDSIVLLSKVRTGIFVMNTEKATKAGIRHLEDVLNQNNLKNNSLLLNNIKTNRWRYYYGKYLYRYGYGYGYGYGYSYGYGYGGGSSYGGYGYGYGETEKKGKKGRNKKKSES